MTETGFAGAFSKFMPKKSAEKLARALYPSQTSVQVVDDDGCIDGYEDGASFDDSGLYLAGTNASSAEKAMNRALNGEHWLINVEAALFWSTWMREEVRSITGKKTFPLFSADMDDERTRSSAEVAVAVCAIRKAFPGDAAKLIKEHVKENPVYSLFWDQAMEDIACLLPDGMD